MNVRARRIDTDGEANGKEGKGSSGKGERRQFVYRIKSFPLSVLYLGVSIGGARSHGTSGYYLPSISADVTRIGISANILLAKEDYPACEGNVPRVHRLFAGKPL